MRWKNLMCAAGLMAMLSLNNAAGQDPDSPQQLRLTANPAELDSLIGHVDWVINRTDLEIRRLRNILFDRETRELKCFAGRYWIDDFDSLIDRRNREVGIWGIEATGQGGLPIEHAFGILR